MVGAKNIPGCNFSRQTWRGVFQPVKRNRCKSGMEAGLMLLALIFYPVCGLADDKADVPQGAESQTTNSDQATGETGQKKETKKDQNLEPIVVTATRSEKSLEDVPAAVSVVTNQDLESRNIQKVDEAMNELPGVFDLRSKPLDTVGTVTMRGMPLQERNLVLLDGEPLSSGFTGQVNWNSLNPLDVARIEVARGPFSSLYGGDAMGGVINIITKTPQQREVTIQSGYGSYNTWSEYASYGDKLYNRLSVFASFSYKESDGYPTVPVVAYPGFAFPPLTPVHGAIPSTDSSGNPTYIIGNTGNNNWWTQSAGLKLVYDINEDSKAFFSYRNSQFGYGYGNPQSYLFNSSGSNIFSGNLSVNGVPLFVASENFLVDKGAYNENIYSGSYETKVFGDAVLKVSGGIVDTATNWYSTPTSLTATSSVGAGQFSDTPADMYNLDVQLNVPLCEKHMITFGGAFRYDEASNPFTNLTNWTDQKSLTSLASDFKGKDNIYSFYTQAEIALLHNLTLYGGVRGDYWKTYGGLADILGAAGFPQYYSTDSDFSVNPKGSLVYKPWDGTTFRSSIGTAFRPPTVFELYTTWEYYGTFFEGNPHLKPETTFSWDVGAEQKLPYNTVAKLNYFSNNLNDYIYNMYINPTLYMQANAGKAESNGVEFEMENKPLDCLKLFANATYIHSKMLSNSADPLSVGKQLQYVPEWMFNLGGELSYRKFSFTLTGRYVAKQYNNADNLDQVSGVFGSFDSFFVADFKVRYKVTDRATLDFAINNMLDEKYFSYYQEPGRNFFGGLTVRF